MPAAVSLPTLSVPVVAGHRPLGFGAGKGKVHADHTSPESQARHYG